MKADSNYYHRYSLKMIIVLSEEIQSGTSGSYLFYS